MPYQPIANGSLVDSVEVEIPLGSPCLLPRHRWPKAWECKYTNPVVRLVLALYGHPDAGGFLEQRCEEVVKQCGWARTSWASLYVHKKTMSLLIIYVDDFRMAAKPEYTVQLWADLRNAFRLDMPTPPDRFLGCYQHHFVSTEQNVFCA